MNETRADLYRDDVNFQLNVALASDRDMADDGSASELWRHIHHVASHQIAGLVTALGVHRVIGQ